LNNQPYTHCGNIDLTDNKMLVELWSVDGNRRKEPVQRLELLLDTGAFITLISKDTAEEYGFKIKEECGCAISGFSEKSLMCDLREIPNVVFCGFTISNVIVATPHDDGVKVAEILGMNLLENFDFGFNLTQQKIFLNKRPTFESNKPKYKVGEISLFDEAALDD